MTFIGCDVIVFQRRDRHTQWVKKSQLANAKINFKLYHAARL